MFGPIRCQRAYYHCGRCGEGYFPWDQAVGLTEHRLTPAAQQLLALAGALGDSFQEAAEEILPRLSALRLSESTVQRTTEDAGQRLGERLAQGETFGPRESWEWHSDAQGRRCAYVGIDAICVPQQGEGGAAAPSRMPYVALVYNPRPDTPPPAMSAAAAERAGASAPTAAADHRPRMQARYLAGLYSLDELGTQMRRQAAQVGMEAADLWIGLSDGGSGLADWVQTNFPRVDLRLILDFWHPAEDLGELARLLQPADAEGAKAQAKQWCQTMKQEGGAAVLKQLQSLPEPRSEAAKEKYTEVVRYIGNNVHRMDYPYYLSQGWHIGSGPVESACKSVVGSRMKLAGMRWKEPGTDQVCHLRALFKSGPKQWDAFWHPSLN